MERRATQHGLYDNEDLYNTETGIKLEELVELLNEAGHQGVSLSQGDKVLRSFLDNLLNGTDDLDAKITEVSRSLNEAGQEEYQKFKMAI